MKLRIVLLSCLVVFMLSLSLPIMAAAEDDDDDDDEGDDNPWGEAAIDHKLNVGWQYPSDYVEQPLVYSKRVTEFGFSYDYRYAHNYWNDNEELIEGSFKTKKQTFNIFLGLGLSDNLSVSLNWPLVYKKTKVFPGNQNYRTGRTNTYGALLEESFLDFMDHSDPWKIWEADLPTLGDINMWTAYQFFNRTDPMTSLAVEMLIKWPTGNDNPRRTGELRNYLTSGNTDWYAGLAAKQQAWKFAFELHAGYNYRMPADTKFSPGKLDLADQVRGTFEVAFQMPKLDPFWNSFAAAVETEYYYRLMPTTIEDNLGNEHELEDSPGYELSVKPKLIYSYKPGWDLHLGMDVPVAGQNSFLVFSRSLYLPPLELESYDGVGITYSIGLVKRWQ